MTEPKQPAAFILPSEVLAGLVAYLASRPYKEVAEGMAALSQLKPYTPEVSDDSGA